MKITETGVLERSRLFIGSQSQGYEKMFYSLASIGHYYCDHTYSVDRERFDSFLMIYVKNGSGTLYVDDKSIQFNKGQVVLVDCYKKHRYSCSNSMEIFWMHFDGQSSRHYYQEIISSHGNVLDLQNSYLVESTIENLYRNYESDTAVNEAQVSYAIITLLTELYLSAIHSSRRNTQQSLVDEITTYINKNLNQELTVDDLAKKVSLSKYYFTRLFKVQTGHTPYEFIIHSRINASKFYLKSSPNLRINEICYLCGFSSESSFCNTFKKIEGITPTQYRNEA